VKTLTVAVVAALHACGALVAQSDADRHAADQQAGWHGDPLEAVRTWLARPAAQRGERIPDVRLSEDQAEQVVGLVFVKLREEARAARAAELKPVDAERRRPTNLLTVEAAGKQMKVYERTFGEAPERGHSLWISMHGGGGAPARVNDGQWHNQIELYQPEEGIYVAPRAPSNTWNLWHEGHIDPLFDRLIENYVIDRGVDPNRVYLMGYSAGGDGVYQLAPRMADRFAAASMMAGHPNGVPMLGLRNLPFMIWMGAKDGAYQRNEQAAAYGKKLDELAAKDPGGYVHETHIVAGKGHWMDREDRKAVPWMARHTREPWPKKVVWKQSGRLHERFYWLSLAAGAARDGQTVRAEVDGQRIVLTTENVTGLRLRLRDALVDLDEPLRIELDGKPLPAATVHRSVRAIYESLQQRLDPATAATAVLQVRD
jgi:poly(3-hydroxybutyrate) depolymerase